MVRTRIVKSGQNGLYVYANGLATVSKCEITGSGNVGVIICEASTAEVKHCKICQNTFEGVWLYEQGEGKILNSDLRGNGRALRNDDNCVIEQSGNKII